MIRSAIDRGVNYIDTAYYTAGERTRGGKGPRRRLPEKVFLATKLPSWMVRLPPTWTASWTSGSPGFRRT